MMRVMPIGPLARSSSGPGASGSPDQSQPPVPISTARTSGPWPAAARQAEASNAYSVTTTIERPALRVAALAIAGILVITPAAASVARSMKPDCLVVAGAGNGSGRRPWTCRARQVRPSAVALVTNDVG